MIYSLQPVDLNAAEWQASTWRREVIVRAETEHAARMFAAGQFAIAVERKLGQRVRVIPWTHAEFVSCIELKDGQYEAVGPAGVLAPRMQQ